MRQFPIPPLNRELESAIQARIDDRTKPPGSLGELERIALRMGMIQETATPKIHNPSVVIFAGDHGAARVGVSPYPQEVTWQMVANFLSGGAAISVFCRQHNLNLSVVDAGVNFDFSTLGDISSRLIDKKIAFGTENYISGPAMTLEQCESAIAAGAEVVDELASMGCNFLAVGEMGIGNTASASLMFTALNDLPIQECVGRGAGHNDAGLERKIALLDKALSRKPVIRDPVEALCEFGGFEIAQMCGAILAGANKRMTVLIDGFISTMAAHLAWRMERSVIDYLFFTHKSAEKAHAAMLGIMDGKPLLDLGMRLGEGSGAAVAYPLFQSATLFLSEMASFSEASVSDKSGVEAK